MESELNFEASFRAKDWTESSLEESVGEEGDHADRKAILENWMS